MGLNLSLTISAKGSFRWDVANSRKEIITVLSLTHQNYSITRTGHISYWQTTTVFIITCRNKASGYLRTLKAFTLWQVPTVLCSTPITYQLSYSARFFYLLKFAFKISAPLQFLCFSSGAQKVFSALYCRYLLVFLCLGRRKTGDRQQINIFTRCFSMHCTCYITVRNTNLRINYGQQSLTFQSHYVPTTLDDVSHIKKER